MDGCSRPVYSDRRIALDLPNILIICSDEHARKFSGCYGHPVAHTPTLDRLSQTGTTFDSAYTPSPICVPARACLATGLQVHETRCWSSAEPYSGHPESWMHRMRDLGYTVLSFGKLHFRSNQDDNGFTEEFLPMHATNDGLGWPQGLLRDPLPPFFETSELAHQTGPGESDYTQYDREIASAACQWIEKSSSQTANNPWILFVSFVSPHYPLTAPAEFYEIYDGYTPDDDVMPASAGSINHPVLKEIRKFWDYDDYFDDALRVEAQRCYFGLVSFLDENIRRVLESVEIAGSLNDTITLYTSDHGEMLGHLGFWTKSVMYENSVGIPLIACGPGFDRVRCKTPVSLTDIAATVEHAAGIESAGSESLRSQALQVISRQHSRSRVILSQYHDGGTPESFFMIRYRQWKYVYYAGGHRPQLFNLDEDPMELIDLVAEDQFQTDRQQLLQRLLQFLDPEDVARQCEIDQKARIDELGGRQAVLAMSSFNHTPVH